MANPYHDPRSGEFTSGPGGSSAEKSHKNVPQPHGEQVREKYIPNIDTQALTAAGAAKNAGREWARNHVGGSSMEARRLAGQRFKSEFERKNFMEGVESIRNPPPSPYAKSNPEDASPFSGPHSSREEAFAAAKAKRALGHDVRVVRQEGAYTVPGRGITPYRHYFVKPR